MNIASNWFNVSAPTLSGFRPWNLFRRHMSDGDKAAGFGLCQIGGRHLLYVGRVEVGGKVRYPFALGFVWITRL